jgi:DNA-binding response OmpR family regulator
MSKKILVVDDEKAVSDLLAYNLRKAQYEVFVAADGLEALAQIERAKPDLILLDVMMPQMDGLDVVRELRKTSDIPVIMITARGEEIDRVVGLELGADDYVCKPFSVRELMSRVKAVLRRTQVIRSEPDAEQLQGPGNLRLDVESREAFVGESVITLTRLEFDVLLYLLQNAGRVLSREQLLQTAWGYDFAGETRAVDSTIKRLRAKLREVNEEADCIEAVRGVGYRVNKL